MEIREKILNCIEGNSKLTHVDLATMLAQDPDFIKDELSAMEKEHIICGYHTLINWDKTNQEKVTALIEVRVTPQRGQGFDNIAKRIYQFNEVTSVFLMSGGYDFNVLIEGSTMKEVALFVAGRLSPIDGVISTATHFVLKKYKEHGIVFEEEEQSERMAVVL